MGIRTILLVTLQLGKQFPQPRQNIKVKKGKSNINIAGFDLTDLASSNVSLKGTFNK